MLHVVQRAFADLDGFTGSMLVSSAGFIRAHTELCRFDLDNNPRRNLFDHPQHEPGHVQSGGIIAEIIARSEPQPARPIWKRP